MSTASNVNVWTLNQNINMIVIAKEFISAKGRLLKTDKARIVTLIHDI